MDCDWCRGHYRYILANVKCEYMELLHIIECKIEMNSLNQTTFVIKMFESENG